MRNENHGDVHNQVQAETVHGGVHFHEHHEHHHLEPKTEPPQQLPPAPETFVDREAEQSALDEVLRMARQHAAMIAITGFSGLGKSALASRWLSGVRSRFADGQIYFDCDLRDGSAIKPVEVVEHCLRALGVDGAAIPASPQSALGMLRTKTSRRKLVLWFDNVRNPDDLLELRPASAESLLLLTSHSAMPELEMHGVRPVQLRTLDPESSLALLTELCGSTRIDAEPEAARRLVSFCGGLPIALRIVAGRLLRRRNLSLSRAAGDLEDEEKRLENLKEKKVAVRAALDLAFEDLPEPQRTVYLLLGVVADLAFSAPPVAVLAEIDVEETEDVLDDLHGANLLEENDHKQYRFHDLVRPHARQLARNVPDRDAALRRLVDWYRMQGAFADRAVTDPTRLRVGGDDVDAAANPYTSEQALEWLEAERMNLLALVRVAAEHEWHSAVISLCDGPLWALHNQHKHYADMLKALEYAVESAREAENLVAEARMLSLRSQLLNERGRFDEAHEQAELAVATAERAGHRRILASALEFNGKALLAKQEFRQAIEFFERSHAINEEIGRARGMALQEYLMGQARYGLEEYQEAARILNVALERLAEFKDRRTPARIRTVLGRVHLALGEHSQAIAALLLAIEANRQRKASFDLAEPLEVLADALDAAGQPGARGHREEALAIYEQAHSPRAEELRRKITE